MLTYTDSAFTQIDAIAEVELHRAIFCFTTWWYPRVEFIAIVDKSPNKLKQLAGVEGVSRASFFPDQNSNKVHANYLNEIFCTHIVVKMIDGSVDEWDAKSFVSYNLGMGARIRQFIENLDFTHKKVTEIYPFFGTASWQWLMKVHGYHPNYSHNFIYYTQALTLAIERKRPDYREYLEKYGKTWT